ncbi:type VI secretion system baseplate subunit TssF [Chitinilyticum litopenaei]|uniref:type VI secretion system baseplate subunit TssF n=1 Tax=Chitinilyticum litopenaei TaxID=1121276 RepID=UPI0004117F37|nr:type VI secretion system baseplate subunit TssF [Chitinilyticum litopenaei]
MNERFLELYNQELRHLRDMGREFARQYPDVAGHLGDSNQVVDPYIERLLEGFAFLSSRVQLKQEAAFPQFTDHLLRCAYPHWSKQTPSMAIVGFTPDKTATGLHDGFAIPRGARLLTQAVPGIETPCEFATAFDVRVWPIRLAEVQYVVGETVQGAPRGTRASLLLTLEAYPGADLRRMSINALDFFVAGDDEVATKLCELIVGNTLGVRVQGDLADRASPAGVFAAEAIRAKGLAEDEALLPLDSRTFSGHRLLQEYFSFPQKFRYFTLGDAQLAETIRRTATAGRVSIAIHLGGNDASLASAVSQESLRLFTTPVINLFSRRMDRILVDEMQTEYHMVADRRKPLAYEVYDASLIEGYGRDHAQTNTFTPLFAGAQSAGWQDSTAFFTLRRQPRLVNENKPQSAFVANYQFSEVFLSVVDRNNAPLRPDVRQFGGDILVSNGPFPILCPRGGPRDLSLVDSAPLEAIQFVVPPTEPTAAIPEGETPWRLINQLSLNYLYLNDQDEAGSVNALKNLLTLYARFGRDRHLAHAQSLCGMSTRIVTRRHPAPGPIAYARGVCVDIRLDDIAFAGASAFVFGQVIRQFLLQFVQLNAFVEFRLSTQNRGLIKIWPAQPGKRGLL